MLKTRMILDGRHLNLTCWRLPFTMGGVSRVAQCAWPGAHQLTIDHELGIHYVLSGAGLVSRVSSWLFAGGEWTACGSCCDVVGGRYHTCSTTLRDAV